MIKNIRSVIARLNATRTTFGWKAAVEWLADRVGDKTVRLQVVEVVWLDDSTLGELVADDPRFEFRFLQADEVRRFSSNPELRLGPELADRIEEGYDFCFAVMDGEQLASYGWYALGCIEEEHNFGVPMSFRQDTAYMYNGFTHPDYRGLRLHGRGMGFALKSLASRDVSHLVSTVDWTNRPSLRSCGRLGYRRLGRVITLGHHRSLVLRAPPLAKNLGIQFGRQAEQRLGTSPILASP